VHNSFKNFTFINSLVKTKKNIIYSFTKITKSQLLNDNTLLKILLLLDQFYYKNDNQQTSRKEKTKKKIATFLITPIKSHNNQTNTSTHVE
jgi:hypothetical protein